MRRLRLVVGFAWGFAEATVFFIVPDVWLGWAALVARRAAWAILALTLAGALLGGAATYAVSMATAASTTAAIADGIPTVDRTAVDRVSREMEEHGPRSVLLGPLRMGTPYKLYARAAGVQEQSLAAFLLWSIPGRLERMLPVTALGIALGYAARGWIAANRAVVVAIYVAIWLAVYTLYVVRIGL